MSTKLKHIEQAQRITERVFEDLLEGVRPSRTERELRDRAVALMRGHGVRESFDTIVAAGRNTAQVHAVSGDRKLRAGQSLMVDLGVRHGGYCSDMTRTVVIGKPSPKMRKVYRVVLRAQEAAIRTIRPGVTGREVDAVARDAIGRAGYGKYFMHALGHGVGRKIHQDPRLSPIHTKRLVPGDVVTVEPGIYLPGRFGVRIEDMVLVTARGNRNLTRTPKRLRSI